MTGRSTGATAGDSTPVAGDPDALTDDLAAAAEAYDAARDDLADVGAARAEAVADALERIRRLFARYEERATGTGDFAAYIEFQDELVDLVEGLDDDLPARDAFEDVSELFQKRRLSESDFERARETLEQAADVAALLDERDVAAKRYADARRAVVEARADRDARVERLETLLELGEADLDAPVDALRDPVAAYDDAVTEAFAAFRAETAACDVVAFAADAAATPLVDYPAPPRDLRTFVSTADVSGESVDDLLAYADYSRSKLAHYVDDPTALKRAVGANRTYLDRLDADPLTVGWPPPPAGVLRYRARELVPLVGAFAPDDAVARLRDVAVFARTDEYDRLRRAAVARDRLSDAARARLVADDVEPERDALRDERARLADALDAYPGPDG